VLPDFDASGNLPPGIHEAAWDEIAPRYGTTPHRRNLLDGLERALQALRRAGCRRAYIDGSLVTAKPDPSDFDVCWEESNVDPVLLDPVLMDFLIGAEGRRSDSEASCFPRTMPAGPGYADFLDYFQHERDTGAPKGIVAINLKDLP
jgi:hypothetical protein